MKTVKNTGSQYCKFGNFHECFIFAKLRSFVKIKPLRNGEITLSFTDVGKSSPSHEFLTWQICLLTLFTKIKLSRKIPNLQYFYGGNTGCLCNNMKTGKVKVFQNSKNRTLQ